MTDRSMFDRLVQRLVWVTAGIGVLALFSQCVLVAVDVLMRWLSATPLHGVIDICQLLNVIVIASFIPFVVFERRNIQIRLFDGLRRPALSAWADSFAHVCTLLFLVIVVWQCARYAVHVSNQVTPILELPIAPVWWVSCGLLLVCVPAQIAVCLRHFQGVDVHGHAGSVPAGEKD